MLDAALLRASWRSWLASDFRRVGPWWLQLVWTFVFCALLALGFTVLGFAAYGRGEGAWRNLAGWWHWYRLNLHMCLVIGFLIHGLFELGARWLGQARVRALAGWRRAAFYSGIPMLGVAIGWPLAFALLGSSSLEWFSGDGLNMIVGSVLIALLLTFVLYQFFEAKARQIEAERRATESQLRLLQAQIEPHFLFNTLANVLSLMEPDPARARRMLESFTDYLRSSLGQLRLDDVPLEAELRLSQAYLQVLQLRMDDRLQYAIEADPAARAVRLPPLLLQPLIENAIRHGIEPKVDGGTIRIRATVQAGQLHLSVEDDGVGLDRQRAHGPASDGNGVATDNIRSRLLSRYHGRATLRLEAMNPGTRAALALPIDEPVNSSC